MKEVCHGCFFSAPHLRRAIRKEDLLPLDVNARSNNIPACEQWPVVLPSPICMELLAIVSMVSVAVWLPPEDTVQLPLILLFLSLSILPS